MRIDNKNLSIKEVCNRVMMVKKMQKLGDPKFSQYSEVIYDDGIWKITMEIFAISDLIRWWVSSEYKSGAYKNSLFTMYKTDNNRIKYSVDFKVKKSIIDKLIKIFKELDKNGIEA